LLAHLWLKSTSGRSKRSRSFRALRTASRRAWCTRLGSNRRGSVGTRNWPARGSREEAADDDEAEAEEDEAEEEDASDCEADSRKPASEFALEPLLLRRPAVEGWRAPPPSRGGSSWPSDAEDASSDPSDPPSSSSSSEPDANCP
jgi:hypothetical protein